MITDIVSSVVLGALSGMGIGGGGLLIIYLTLVKNYSQTDARAINLLFFIFAAASSLLIHVKKRKMDPAIICIFAVFGIAGSLIGTQVAKALSPEAAAKFFGIMLVVSGIITLVKSTLAKNPSQKARKNRQK